jgi:hypothetical protein
MKLKATWEEIKKHNPCSNGYKKAREYHKLKNEVHLLDILESNGIMDALWCLRIWPEYNREWRLFAVWCARQVQHLITDSRSITAIDVAERFANGDASSDELKSALDASRAAASYAASYAAMVAAMDAASYAARVAASYAASSAARVAASSAALDVQKEKLIEIINEIEVQK